MTMTDDEKREALLCSTNTKGDLAREIMRLEYRCDAYQKAEAKARREVVELQRKVAELEQVAAENAEIQAEKDDLEGTLNQIRESDVWVIWYDDADVSPEVFAKHGAADAARERFRVAQQSWTSRLMVTVAGPTRHDLDPLGVLS